MLKPQCSTVKYGAPRKGIISAQDNSARTHFTKSRVRSLIRNHSVDCGNATRLPELKIVWAPTIIGQRITIVGFTVNRHHTILNKRKPFRHIRIIGAPHAERIKACGLDICF